MTKASTLKPGKAEKRRGLWLSAANWLLVAVAALVPFATGYVPFAGRAGVFMGKTETAQSVALGLLVGGALVCWAVVLVRGEARVKPVPYGWVLAAFLLVVLASVVTALDRMVAVFGNEYWEQGLLTMAAYAAVLVLATQIVEGRRDLLRILKAVALSGAVVALFGVLQVLGLPFFPGPLDAYLIERGSSTLGNPDMLGTFLIVPLLISLGLSAVTGGRRRWLWIVCVAVTAASLLLTQTRGAWLGALVAVAIFGVVIYRSPRQGSRVSMTWAGAGLLVFLGVGVAVFRAVNGGQPLLSRLTGLGGGADGGRLLVWSEVLKVIGRYPILGAGPDNIVYGWYQVSHSELVHSMGLDGVISDAHNYWLGTAVSSGIIAAALLIGFVVAVLVGSRGAVTRRLAVPGAPDRVAYAALWAGTAGLVVALVFSPLVTPIGLILWLSLGLLAAPKARPMHEAVSRNGVKYVAVAVSAIVGLSLVGWGGATGLSASVEYLRDGSVRDPVQAARTAHRIAPWRQDPLNLEAQRLNERGASAQEIAPVFDQLIRLAPRESFYYYFRAKAYVLGGQPNLAIATANRGLAMYPAGLRLTAERALAQAMLGDFVPAEREAAAAWSLSQDVIPTHRDPTIGIVYAQVLSQEGKKAQANAVLDELQAEFPGNADVANMHSILGSGGN